MYSRSGRDTPASVASAASLWSVPPSFRRNEVTVIPDSTQEEQKPLSDGKMLMKISIYSLSVTTASIFYFPEAAYKHGGSFVLAYMILMVLFAQPLVYFELLLGQLYGPKGPAGRLKGLSGVVFRGSDECVTPQICAEVFGTNSLLMFALGIPFAQLTALVLFIPNQSILSHFSNMLFEISDSIKPFPWCSCENLRQNASEFRWKDLDKLDKENRTATTCIGDLYVSTVADIDDPSSSLNPFEAMFTKLAFAPIVYLRDEVLHWELRWPHILTPVNFFNVWNYKLLISAVASAVGISSCVFDGPLRSAMSKVILWIPFAFIASLLVLLVTVLKTTGRVGVLLELFSIRWTHLAKFQVWQEAIRHAMLTSCLGLGFHTTVASSTRISYKKYNHISWIFTALVVMVALISTAVFFSMIELLQILADSDSVEDIVPQSMATALLSTVFCLQKPSAVAIVLYGTFYAVKYFALLRFHVMAVETLNRLLHLGNNSNERRFVKIFSTSITIVVTQITFVLPYAFPPTENLLQNFPALCGCCSIIILLLVQICVFSSKNGTPLLKDDLCLRYGQRLPKIFLMQLESWFSPAVVIVCTVLLWYEFGLRMYLQAENLSQGKWQTVYGFVLNLIPILILLTVICLQGVQNGRRRLGTCRSKPMKIKRLRKRMTRTTKRFEHSLRNEIETPVVPLSATPRNGEGDRTAGLGATINPSRLRNPQADLVTRFGTKRNLRGEQLSPSLVLSSSPMNSENCESQETIRSCLERPNLRQTPPRVSSLRVPNPKKKPPRQAQRHLRRPPLPLQWSPGGLGDFTLYDEHLEGKPPGVDPVIEGNVTMEPEGSPPSTALCDLNCQEIEEIISDAANDTLTDCKCTSNSVCQEQHTVENDDAPEDFLPPPPSYILEDIPSEYYSLQQNLTEYFIEGQQELPIQNSTMTTDGAGDPAELDRQISVGSIESNGHLAGPRLDLVSPKVAKELNISFPSDSDDEQNLENSYNLSSFCDGSAPSESFLYTEETSL